MGGIKAKRALCAIILLAMLAMCPVAVAAPSKNRKPATKTRAPAKKASTHTKPSATATPKQPSTTPSSQGVTTPVPSTTSAITQAVCRTYTVQSGDSAMSVAQSQGIDYDQLVSALAQCIGYTDGNILQVGQSICLPPFTPSCKYVTSSGAASCKVYTVQAGDTLDSISKAFSMYPQTLIDVNEGKVSSKEPVHPGLVIKLPPWDKATCKSPDADAPKCRVYYVKSGDTIYSVASTFGLSSEEIVGVNSGLNVNSPLTVGQPLRLPPFPAECGNQGISVTGPSGGVSTSCRTYIVGKGDSLSSIASKYDTTSDEILSVNSQVTNAQALTVGMTLKLPPWDDSCSTGNVVNQPPTVGNPVTLIPNPPAQSVPVPVINAPAPPPVQVNRPVTTNSPPTSTTTTSTASAPKIAPAPSTTASNLPTTDVEMVLQGASSQDFASKQAAVIQALAQAAGVPVEAVSVRFVLGIALPSRRMLSTTDVVKVQCTVQGNPVSVQNNLKQSVSDGSLNTALQAQGLTLKTLTTISATGEVTPILTPDGIVGAVNNDKHVSKYIIIGAAVGGGILLLLVTIGCCQIASRRRRQREMEEEEERAAAAAKARYIGANVYVSTVSKKKLHNGSFTDGMISSENHVRAPARTPSRALRPSQEQSSSGESLPGMPIALQQAAREAYAQPIDIVVSDRSAESKPQYNPYPPQQPRNQEQPQQQPSSLQQSPSAKSVTFEAYAPPGVSPPVSPKLSPKRRSSSQSRTVIDVSVTAGVPMMAVEESSTSPGPSPRVVVTQQAPPARITTVNTTATLRASSVSPPPSPEMRRAVSRGGYDPSPQISPRGSVRSSVAAPRPVSASSSPTRAASTTVSASRQQQRQPSPSRLPRVATLSSSPSAGAPSRRAPAPASPPTNLSPRSRSTAAPLPRVATLGSSSSRSSQQQQVVAPRVSNAPMTRTSSYTRQSSSSIPGSLRSKMMGAPPPTQPTRVNSTQPSPRSSPTRSSRRSLYGDL